MTQASQSPPLETGFCPPRWLPNAITVLRIALIPAFCVVGGAAADQADPLESGRMAAAGLLFALAISDMLDGWLARRFDLASPLGALLDAFADKLAQVALLAFFTFVEGPAFPQAPLWFFCLVVLRDATLAVGWLLVKWRCGRVEVVHEPHGRLTSFLVFALLLYFVVGGAQSVVDIAALLLAILILFSTWHYAREGWRQFTSSTRSAV